MKTKYLIGFEVQFEPVDETISEQIWESICKLAFNNGMFVTGYKRIFLEEDQLDLFADDHPNSGLE